MSDVFEKLEITENGYLIPSRFVGLTDEFIAYHSNGCGAEGAKLDLVPDTIAGIDFLPACLYHDLTYYFGKDEKDKRMADRIFLFNLLVAVDEYCQDNNIVERMQRIACREAAFDYYKAVSDWGRSAFWKDKS